LALSRRYFFTQWIAQNGDCQLHARHAQAFVGKTIGNIIVLKNTCEAWGSAAKFFHWLMAFLILVEVPAGLLMSHTYGMSFRDREAMALHTFASQVHHTLGLCLLLLLLSRLAWRLGNVTPAAAASRFRWQKPLSRFVQLILYGLLLAIPLSGWAALSVYRGAPIWLFNMPGLVPPILSEVLLKAPYGYSYFAHLHVWALLAGAGVLCLHMAVALWHHFVNKDTSLLRMWPLGRTQRAPDLRSEP
jgi:cytochrome b561